MIICQNAEGVHGQREVGNPCARSTVSCVRTEITGTCAWQDVL